METENSKLLRRTYDLIKDIHFPNYFFYAEEKHGGVMLWAQYYEHNVYTPKGTMQATKPEKQVTRKWRLTPSMTDSEIVQTAFKCIITSAEHRTREHFTFMKQRVFSPHYNVYDLVEICREGKSAAGGRKA